VSAPLADALRALRAGGDYQRVLSAIPYARFLGLTATLQGDVLTTCMPPAKRLIGNPVLPALHGGPIGALLETAAILELLRQTETDRIPKPINVTVQYLRSAKVVDTFARAEITRHGRRVANVQVRAWQDDSARPVAAAQTHFLLRSAAKSGE
jgi:uncharacterized protein (TIGR00369 family)